MEKFLTVLLVIVFIAAPLTYTEANETDMNEIVAAQLTAISNYLERTFNLRVNTPLSQDDLSLRIENGTKWLKKAQEGSGHFKYEYLPYENRYREDDHIVRQAGTFFELGEIARRDKVRTLDVENTMERALMYFQSVTKADDTNARDLSCITRNNASLKCYLGATSLALLGLLGYFEAYPENIEVYRARSEEYLDFILKMKKTEGGFRDTHYVERPTQNDTESSFSNGEALLALVRYYAFNPQNEIKILIDETFEYLKNEPYDVGMYLWMMAALKDMQELWPNEEYISYGKAFTDWRIERAARFRNTKNNYCALAEGIVSAYSFLESSLSDSERALLRNEIDYWNTKNSWLQLGKADFFRVIDTDGVLSLGMIAEPLSAYGGFLTGENTLTERIDFTQHCVSAYLQTLVDIDGETLKI